MPDANSQLDGLWDTCAAAILNTWDAYSWVLPALLLTLLFFGVFALICFALEDLDFDASLIEAPVAIFRWSKKTFQSQRPPLRYSITPSISSPSPAPPPSSSARE
jgi:hypothetical protein